MIFENKKSEVLFALQKRGHDEEKIAGMSPKEAFIEFCEWNGLLSWGETLWNQAMTLSGHAAEVPALELVSFHGYGEPVLSDTSRARLMNAVVRAYGGRIDLETLMRGGRATIGEMSDSELVEFASSQVPRSDLPALVERIPELRLR